MKRMYYLTGNLDSTEQISNDIHSAGISDWHFHVISRDEAGLYRRHVHGANLFQKQDVLRYGERGGMAGFIAALLVTLYIGTAEPFGPNTSGLVYIAVFGFITLFGAWVGGLAGLATENKAIARFHDAIAAGQYLILIDVPKEKEGMVRELMEARHPEARLMQVGSTLINPFDFSSPKPA
jgi:hypothetical protein